MYGARWGTTGALGARRVDGGLTVPVVEALRTLDDEDASAVGVEGAGLSGAGADADAGVFAFFRAMAHRLERQTRRAADQLATREFRSQPLLAARSKLRSHPWRALHRASSVGGAAAHRRSTRDLRLRSARWSSVGRLSGCYGRVADRHP